MTAVFRETESLPVDPQPSRREQLLALVDGRDVLAAVSAAGLAGGLGMVWLPLAFVTLGALGLALAVYMSLPPRRVE